MFLGTTEAAINKIKIAVLVELISLQEINTAEIGKGQKPSFLPHSLVPAPEGTYGNSFVRILPHHSLKSCKRYMGHFVLFQI